MPKTVKRRGQRGGFLGFGESNGSSWWNPSGWFKSKDKSPENNVASVPGPGSSGYFGGKRKTRRNRKGGKKSRRR